MTTKKNADCKSKGLCHYDGGTRTKFFHGMLLTDEHLRLEQSYHREALNRIHRYLWGPGIVCGFEVEWVSALCVKVHPGLAVDCRGNAIELCQCLTVDLTEECKKQYPGGCTPNDAKPFKKYLVVRYATIEEDPQPVLMTGDECGGPSRCEKSRVREGFCLDLVDKCPPPCDEDQKEDQKGTSPYQIPPGQQASSQSSPQSSGYGTGQDPGPQRGIPDCMKPLRKCPLCECGCDTCDIGLATLEIDCNKATLKVTCDCRAYAHERRDRNALYTRFVEQDKRAVELEKRSADITRRVEELERLRNQIEYGLQTLQSAGARVDHLESRLESLAPADRVLALENEIELRAREDRVQTLEQSIRGQASEAGKITALEAKVELLNSQLVAFLQRKPPQRGARPATP